MRHFVLQDERPDHLGDVALTEMDASLRCLLFTDGTVTRALEAQTLSRVSVDVVDQHRGRADDDTARLLETAAGAETLFRRVVISAGMRATPLIWAESHLLPERLPTDFLAVLEGAPDGIGESLQQVKLESWRDMLWFGLDALPSWDGVAPCASPAITRSYRVVTGRLPALLITESFAVEERGGTYYLSCAV
jgi:chorismate-pyruvate lyase